MRSNGQLYRLAMAFLISIALNVILFAVDFSIDPRRAELPRIQRWVVSLLSPAEALTMGFAPGHGGAQILALVIFSVFVYAIAAWVALSLPALWRRRA
jgi:hypothetical protein